MNVVKLYQEIEKLLNQHRTKKIKKRYEDSFPLFIYLASFHLEHYENLEPFNQMVIPSHEELTILDRCKYVSVSYLQYFYNYEYIIEDLNKLPAIIYSQEQLEKIIADNEQDKILQKIKNHVKSNFPRFTYDRFQGANSEDDLYRTHLSESLNKDHILSSEYIFKRDEEYILNFEFDEHDRLNNAFTRIINCFGQNYPINSVHFHRALMVDEQRLKRISNLLNDKSFYKTDVEFSDRKIKELIPLMLTHSILEDVKQKLSTNMLYQPPISRFNKATDGVDRFAKYYIDFSVIDSQVHLIRKLHAKIHDREGNRFTKESIKKGLQSKGYNSKYLNICKKGRNT